MPTRTTPKKNSPSATQDTAKRSAAPRRKTEEQLAKDRLRISERRKEHQRKVENNELEFSNMAFLKNILKNMQLSQNALAKGANMNSQTISWWITADDTYLQNVVTLFEKNGCRLTCQYLTDKDPGPEGGNCFAIKVKGIGPSLKMTRMNSVVKSIAEDDSAITQFIGKALVDAGISIMALAGLMGRQYSTVRQWLLNPGHTGKVGENIKISHIYMIANTMGWKVIWNLEAK